MASVEEPPPWARAAVAQSQSPGRSVLISHSSSDKGFVHRLLRDLRDDRAPVQFWLDEEMIALGDSLVRSISEALKQVDYLLLIHSMQSAKSEWVAREVEAATALQISGDGIAVIVAKLDSTPLPPMLAERLWVNFAESYKDGYQRLLTFFRSETPSSLVRKSLTESYEAGDDCPALLSKLAPGEIRRRLQARLSRDEVAQLWFDLFVSRMDDYLPQKAKDACLIEMLLRCNERRLMEELCREICREWPELASP